MAGSVAVVSDGEEGGGEDEEYDEEKADARRWQRRRKGEGKEAVAINNESTVAPEMEVDEKHCMINVTPE